MDYILLNLLIFLFPVITFAAGILILSDPEKNVGTFDRLFPKKSSATFSEKCTILKAISRFWTVAGAISIVLCAAIIVILHNSTLYLHIAEIAILVFVIIFITGFTYAKVYVKINKKLIHTPKRTNLPEKPKK